MAETYLDDLEVVRFQALQSTRIGILYLGLKVLGVLMVFVFVFCLFRFCFCLFWFCFCFVVGLLLVLLLFCCFWLFRLEGLRVRA